jgi:hypothetical protein
MSRGRKPGGLSFRAAPPAQGDTGARHSAPRGAALAILLSLPLWVLLIVAAIHLIARILP